MAITEKAVKPELEPVKTGDIVLDCFIHLKWLGRVINRESTTRLTKLGLSQPNLLEIEVAFPCCIE